MAKAAITDQPVHDDVVHRLRDSLPKLGIKYVQYLAEAKLRLGPDVQRRMDLVTIAGIRTRGGRKGTIVNLFEVKTEQCQLFQVVHQGVQQLSVYELGLANPSLYVVGEAKQQMLENSLAYRKYLVIPQALWDEWDDLSDEDVEKMSEILALRNVGIITFDTKWKFRLDKVFGNPSEEETPYLGKAVGPVKSKHARQPK